MSQSCYCTDTCGQQKFTVVLAVVKKKETTTGKNVSFKAFLPDPTSALLLYLEDLQINCPNNHLKTSGVARLADNLSKGQ